jgi:hypothetical protein
MESAYHQLSCRFKAADFKFQWLMMGKEKVFRLEILKLAVC